MISPPVFGEDITTPDCQIRTQRSLFFGYSSVIFLSTLAGATLIVQMAAFNPWVEIALFLALVVAGMAFQAKTMPCEHRAQ
jgi:hypothetical protein